MRQRDVKKMQHRLKAVGFSLRVDGDYGPQTSGVVLRFEQGFAAWDKALTPRNGRVTVGGRTWNAIRWSDQHGGKCSNHFTWRQTACKDPNNPAIGVKRSLLLVMDRIYVNNGPFTPVSVYRTEYWNHIQGGVRGSEHVDGTACDVPEGEHLSVTEAVRYGADGIGYDRSSGWVEHVDTRGFPSRWTYT